MCIFLVRELTSPLESHLGRAVATPHDREWTRPLRVLLAAQYLLQINPNPITQPRVRYIHSAMSHASYTLHCAIRFPPQKKRNSPFLTADFNPQSFQWNNAYNSAYVQTETLNFTITRQAVIVYFYICSTHRRGYCRYDNTNAITSPRVTAYNLLRRSQNIGNCVTFLHIFRKLQHRS